MQFKEKTKILFATLFIIFSFVLIVLFTAPLYKNLSKSIQDSVVGLLNKIEDEVGVSIKYKKLSAAFLFGATIFDINVTDSFSNAELINISKIKINYNLSKILTKKIDNIINDVNFDKIYVNFDVYKNQIFLEKITQFFSKTSSNKQNNRQDTQIDELLDKKIILNINIPFKINVKKLFINFLFKDFSIQSQLNKINLNTLKESNKIALFFKGKLGFNLYDNSNDFFNNIKTDFSISAQINSKLEDSFVQLKLNNLQNNFMSFVPLQFLIRYNQNIFDISLLQNSQNFLLQGNYNLLNNILNFNFDCDNFAPLKLIKIKEKSSIYNKIEDSKITGSTNLNLSLNDFNYDYVGTLLFQLSKKLISTGMNINANFSGNEDIFNAHNIDFYSSNLKANYVGSFNIKKLQPEGVFTLENVVLQNNNSFNTEIYFDPLQKGFMFIIPQLSFNEQFFSAIQGEIIPNNNSVDFSVELYDYTHMDSDEPGKLSFSGSYLLESENYLQTQIDIDTFALNAFFNTALFFAKENIQSKLKKMQTTFLPYVMSTQMYVSSNLKKMTYNVPYFVIANTKKDKEFALLSFNGNESNISISQCNVLFLGQSLQANFNADFSNNFKDIMFSSDLTFNSIPYELSGIFTELKDLTISGNYGLNANLNIHDKKIEGSFGFNSLPLQFKNFIFAFSLDSNFHYYSLNDWKVTFNKIEVYEPTLLLPKEPRIALVGSFDSYGLMLNTISYSDVVSMLNGSGSAMWSFDNSIIDTASVNIDLKNFLSTESYTLNLNISNPQKYNFSNNDFIKNLFFSADIKIGAMPSSRFFTNQTVDNNINAEITALGILDNPAISLSFHDSSFLLNSTPLKFNGQLLLEDGSILLNGFRMNYGDSLIQNTVCSINLKDFTGEFFGEYTLNNSFDNMYIPIKIQLKSFETKTTEDWSITKLKIPKNFTMSLQFPKINSNFFGNHNDINFQLIKTQDRFDLVGGKNNEIKGYYKNTNEIFLSMDKSLPLSFIASGNVSKDNLNVNFNDVFIDSSFFAKFVQFPEFGLSKGVLQGSFILSGIIQDPEFIGTLTAQNFEFVCPSYVQEKVYADKIIVKADKNIIYFDNTIFNTIDTPRVIVGSVKLTLDRWKFDNLKIKINSLENKFVKAKTVIDFMEFAGNAQANLLIDLFTNSVVVKGSIFAENVDGVFSPFTNNINANVPNSDFQSILDLKFIVGHRSQVFLPTKRNPIMRGLIAPNTEITFKMDTIQNIFELKGDLVLRGGEVAYGSRNFYLREGRLILNETADTFDPIISIRAETRERDEDGNQIKIILSAQNQHFTQFTPAFSSNPAKSEQEILEILALSFSDNLTTTNIIPTALAMGGEMLINMTLFKQIESALRETLNFDIFSLRTNILQNSMNEILQSINNSKNEISFSNFIDNTSVYIGKYVGNDLYIDFLGQFDYNDRIFDANNFDEGKLTFRPEIGLEVASPFGNLRWQMIPTLDNLFDNTAKGWPILESLNKNTSFSMSWKFEL